ncbi:N-acyl homoserine lactonase family protein [Rhizobium sp. BK251]|uniref:N-acyl homoserine lactonase family protein n=1 Tax=Rhizobium sp. BK251 TaxID=2512125 RepID=UPI0010528403|nr:N-acyl homoserine lactonase family protein [Rhizobium sp. BK251]TCL69731.1 metallo-beta-lactamase superfamily protein [Rhizobium sp. BK251]
MIRITPIETGKARMKTAQKTGRDGRGAFGRKVDIFRDRNWVDPLPIFCFLIEHPEGRFLVDTGDTWRNSVPGYLPRWNPFFTREVVIKVAPLEEIGPRLAAMGLDPARDIEVVILTHFHHDHTGGLDHFPHNRIIAPRENYEVSRGLMGMMMGCLPQRWPVWLKPELVDMDGPPVGPFPASHPITRDGSIFLVPTPGHAKGHVSVVVRDAGITYFLAGDATYTEANLANGKADGVTYDPTISEATLRAIRQFATSEPTIILPAHDPDGPARLAAGRTFTGS